MRYKNIYFNPLEREILGKAYRKNASGTQEKYKEMTNFSIKKWEGAQMMGNVILKWSENLRFKNIYFNPLKRENLGKGYRENARDTQGKYKK